MKPGMLLLVGVAGVLGADVPSVGDAVREVQKSLQALNAAFVKRDLAVMKRLMADDHVAITPYYGMVDREAQLKNLPETKITTYKEAGLKVTLLTKDVARVTYRLTTKGTYKRTSISGNSYALAIWVKRDGRWQEVSYQETPMKAK
jgi:hypothetical protein